MKLVSKLPRGGYRVVRRLARQPVMVPTIAGEVCCDLRESVCYPLLKYGTYPHAAEEFEYLRNAVGPQDVVFDVGANIGFTAKLFLRTGARVIAFEPSPKAFQLLLKTLAGEGEARNLALSDRPGRLHFTECDQLDTSHVSDTGIEVEATTIDALSERPTFIKIDVEGHEPAVLRGATCTLSAGPRVFFEALTDAAYQECRDIISAANQAYRFRRVGGNNFLAEGAR